MSQEWPSIADLLVADKTAPVALLGAPMNLGCVTPGHYDQAPDVIRKTLARISSYDVETNIELKSPIYDAGNADIAALSPADGFHPLVEAFAPLLKTHKLAMLIGGHNGITRAGVHALDPSLKNVGLLTLDAHFDMRSTKDGLMNGNPVRALIEDGLPGTHIAQIGLAPFANTKAMHDYAKAQGVYMRMMQDCTKFGFVRIINEALALLASRCEVIYVDFDIDVIDRAQMPGAPGARPGGVSAQDFYAATRLIAAHPKVKAVDLCEFDPSLDVANISALTAARWVGEVLMGIEEGLQ